MNKEDIIAFQENQKRIIAPKVKDEFFGGYRYNEPHCIDEELHDYIELPTYRDKSRYVTFVTVCKKCGYRSSISHYIETDQIENNTIEIDGEMHYDYATFEEMEKLKDE